MHLFMTIKFPLQVLHVVHNKLKSLMVMFPSMSIKVSWERLSPDLHIVVANPTPKMVMAFQQAYKGFNTMVQYVNNYRLNHLVKKFLNGLKKNYTKEDYNQDVMFVRRHRLVNYNINGIEDIATNIG